MKTLDNSKHSVPRSRMVNDMVKNTVQKAGEIMYIQVLVFSYSQDSRPKGQGIHLLGAIIFKTWYYTQKTVAWHDEILQSFQKTIKVRFQQFNSLFSTFMCTLQNYI
jgi:hypothetical protein